MHFPRTTIAMALAMAFIFFSGSAHAQGLGLTSDNDGDGLTNYQEQNIFFTDANNADTDGDGVSDGLEIRTGNSPLAKNTKLKNIDSDQDGLSDDWEIKLGTNLMNPDTDGDGFLDSQEVENGFSPLDTEKVSVEKKITVDIKKFRLDYYFGQKLLESVPISTGLKNWPTPTGEFTILDKVPLKNWGGGSYSFFYPNTKWNLLFTAKETNGLKLKYFIHSAYWHNQFGKKNVSSGCVNLPVKDMELLYKFARVGTKVVIK